MLKDCLEHSNPQFRVAAIRATRRAAGSAETANVERLLASVHESHSMDAAPAVRREIAISLRNVPWNDRIGALQNIATRFDGWDRWYLEAIGIASQGHEAEAYRLLVAESGVKPAKWSRRLAGIAWRLHPATAAGALTERAMSDSIPYRERFRMMTGLAFIPDRVAAESMLKIATKGPDDLQGMARWWGKNRDANDWKDFELGEKFPSPPDYKKPKKYGTPRLDFALPGEPVFSEIGATVEIDVNLVGASRLYLVAERVISEEEKNGPKPEWKKSPTIKTLKATWKNPRLVGKSVVSDKEGEIGMTFEEKLTDREWADAFCLGQPTSKQYKSYKWEKRIRPTLPTLTSGDSNSIQVSTRSIITYEMKDDALSRFKVTGVVDQSANPNEKIRFSVYLDKTPAGEQIPAPEKVLAVKGDASHGRALFFSKRLNCASCHAVSGFGGGVGPELTAIAKKHAPPVLIEGIINPSAAISMGFETMNVLTADGKTISGLTVSAGNPVVLKDGDGKIHTIPQDEIEEMNSSKVSMMPSLKEQLTTQELASLLAFLQEMKME
jgi:putative heme-binding domain-containing protein